MNAALIINLLNVINSGIKWLTQRGINQTRIQEILTAANTENRDITTADVQAELDALDSELDATEVIINENPD